MRLSGCEVLEKLVCVSALHESWLEQLRIIGFGVAFRLALADDRQDFDLFYGLGPSVNRARYPSSRLGLLCPRSTLLGA